MSKIPKLPPFDIAQHLHNDREVVKYLLLVLAETDAAQLAAALGDIARARWMKRQTVIDEHGEVGDLSHVDPAAFTPFDELPAKLQAKLRDRPVANAPAAPFALNPEDEISELDAAWFDRADQYAGGKLVRRGKRPDGQHNPPHPGETLREDVLPALGLTVTQAAAQLGVSRVSLSRVLHGKAGISPEMALRLERWLGVERGGRASVWLGMQSAYDLWHAERAMPGELERVHPAPAERRDGAG